MPEYAVGLAILGVVAGIMSGMFGIGGGAIIVPALTMLLGYGLKEANGTSLAVLLLPVSIFAVLAYYRKGLIEIRVAALISLGLICGLIFGAQFALAMPADILERAYGFFLIYVGWRFIEPRKLYAEYTGKKPTAPAEASSSHPDLPWFVMFGVGLVAGLAGGLFGIGGGLVIVPILVGLLKYDQKRAVGTSLAALLPPVGIGAVIAYYQAGQIQLGAAVLIAAGLVFGAFAGARIALGLPSATVKRLYGLFLLVISLRFIFQL